VVDEAYFAKLVHEVAHARPSRSDHLGKHFLSGLCNDGLWAPFGDPHWRPDWMTGMAIANQVRNILRKLFPARL
jgi:hypothetical protein